LIEIYDLSINAFGGDELLHGLLFLLGEQGGRLCLPVKGAGRFHEWVSVFVGMQVQ
jgi:hypothetical protein